MSPFVKYVCKRKAQEIERMAHCRKGKLLLTKDSAEMSNTKTLKRKDSTLCGEIKESTFCKAWTFGGSR